MADYRMRIPKVLRLLLAGALAAAAPRAALCHTPIKGPIRMIVAVAAGSTSDVAARLVAEKLTGSLGQPVFVEDRPGASGGVAARALRSAAPDGTTLLLAPIVVPVLVPLVFNNPGFDPARDFAPIAQVSRFAYALAVRADHPARTLAEFVVWAKAHPGQASFATGGAGSIPHFLGVMLDRTADMEMVHVPYRSFATQEADLIGGHVAASIDALPNVIALQRSGKIRVLATSGAERSPQLPAVPTFKEQGYPVIVAVGWNAIFAPANTPAPVVDRLSAATIEALRSPETRQTLTDLGLEPTGTTPEELKAIMATDTARWAATIKAAGFTPE